MTDELHRAGHVVLEVWRSAPAPSRCRLRCTCGWRTEESLLGEGLPALREAHLSEVGVISEIGRQVSTSIPASIPDAQDVLDDDDLTLVTAAHPALPFSDFSGDDRTVAVAVPDWLEDLNRVTDGRSGE